MTQPLRLVHALRVAVLALVLFAGAALAPASAAETFPALTGHVVDQAQILSATERGALEGKLAELERKSGIQLVVATVSTLDGEEIEPYANALFRAWKLGEAKKNNGVLFLIAPNQHRLRIEVGYGLEGTLTDATSSIIIANAVAPRFKAGDFDGGVARGVGDIITVLTTDSAEWQKKPDMRAEPNLLLLNALPALLFLGFFLFMVFRAGSHGGGLLGNVLLASAMMGQGRGSFGGGDFGGGGFSGGGGSSGGGGASGSW